MLSNFGSYFEIFAVLNLGYATSKTFRNVVDSEILKMSEEYSPKVKSKIKEINAKISTYKLGEIVNVSVSNVEEKFKSSKDEILNSVALYKKFPNGQRPMFLITTLFCFAILVIGGFESFFSCERVSLRIVRFLSYTTLGFNLCIFIRSFDSVKNSKEIPLPVTILLFSVFFLIPVLICYIFPIADDYKEGFVFYNLGLSIFVAFSPYLFHFIRTFINKTWYSYRYHYVIRKCNNELRKKENALRELFSE